MPSQYPTPPKLTPVQEEVPRDHANLENVDGAADNGSSIADGNCSVHGSILSARTDSKHSVQTFSKFSAFTAPPRYRNSGAFVHGTKFRNFKPIMQEGLKAAKSEIFMIDEVRADGRVPGLPNPPEILIFIDENKARSENMEFEYDSGQGTWKTKGIGGVIRPWFFQKVLDQRRGPGRGNVLFQSKEDPMMQANVIRGPQRPQYLIHATYWENVFGIMSEGIVPAKNPTSTVRQPFKELLQGAESHVYTVSCPWGSACEDLPSDLVRAISERSEPEAGGRRTTEPEVVPEDEAEPLHYKVTKDEVGLERAPDAFFIIDTHKADALGVRLDMVQSADREDTILVQGPVPRELLTRVEANDPMNLPECLRAKIVDPRSFNEIPIIDLRQDEATLVSQLQYACEVVGFMQVVGHGVSTELQLKHMEMQRRFFQLPDHIKTRIALSDENPVRGWFGKGGEDLDQVLQEQVDKAEGQKIVQQSRKDNKEALDTNGVPWSRPRGGAVAAMFGMPSQLPAEEELPGFREVIDQYAKDMFQLARRLLSLMALVLGLPRDFFEQHLTAPVATHRLLHYWPLKDFNTEIGVGEHTDYGLLTILKQDSVGGLQVLNAKDSIWVHCCPVDDAFVVNLGDMMSRWTASRFKSTVHRVVNVSPEERYSVPYFLEPNMDSLIVHGALCDGALGKGQDLTEHQRRCRLRKLWQESRKHEAASATAEDILERFYRAAGQLRVQGFKVPDQQA